MSTTGTSDVIVREITIAAPATRVFDALSNPDHRLQWWGREGRFKATAMESDLRPGGAWKMTFDSNGRQSTVEGTYRRIEPPHLLEFTWRPTWDQASAETTVRFDLTEQDGRTTVRVTHSGLLTERERQSHQGWPDLLEALRAFVVR